VTGSIGVLLPARLETRFDQRDDGSWRLRLLVVPGEASVDLHDELVREDELDRLERAAAACNGLLAAAEGETAFESLAQEIGAGRARWLVRTRLRVDAAGWSIDRADAVGRVDAEPVAATVRGLPDRLEIWAETETGDVLLRRLRPGGRVLPITPPRTDLPADERPDVFWASWRVLRGVGLAGAVNLTAKGIEPQDIRRLVVVGLGDEPADRLFAAHANAGNAALLRPGTATNVTAGSVGHPAPNPRDHHALLLPPAAPEELARPARTASEDVARALTGAVDGLPRMLGGDVDHRSLQHGLVQTLWPALWGHAAQDLWGPADRWPAYELGWWLAANLLPQGPLATLLVDDQPYGLLPLTPLDGAGEGHPVDERLAPALAEAVRTVADLAAEQRDTVLDADAERLLRVLGRTPTSRGHAWRWSIPLRYLAHPDVTDTQARAVAPYLNAAGHDATASTDPPMALGVRRRVTVPAAEVLARRDAPDTAVQWGLVERWLDEVLSDPNPEGELLRQAVEAFGEGEPTRVLVAWLWHRIHPLRDDPTSLNDRLEGLGDPWPDSLWFHLARLAVNELWRWGHWASELRLGPPQGDTRTLRDYGAAWPSPGDATWVTELFAMLVDGLHDLGVRSLGRTGDLDRATAALLDTATHRLDPWAVGLAWRRLEQRDDARRVLGLYGYVDQPFRGQAGLGDRGVTLAPSPDQAKTAAIVRDRAVAHHHDGLAPSTLKDVTLDSERVRLALRITRAVREGAHPAEALGREFERMLPDARVVRRFRAAYPAHRTDAGRRTCDGLKAAAAVTSDTIGTDTGLTADDATARRFALLAEMPADLADLLVLEAVHDTVTGGAAQAAVALDAAAGLAAPPDLRFPTTPAGGTALRTTLRVELPDVALARTAEAPGDACPAVAAHLDSLGDPAGSDWTWWADEAVTLTDLGLSLADLVAVDDDTLLAEAASRLGVPAAEVTPASGLEELRRLVDVLARCAPPAEIDVDALADVERRVQTLLGSVLALAEDLDALDPEAAPPPALARRVLRWGLRGPAGSSAARLRALLPQGITDLDAVRDLAELVPDLVAELGRLGGGAGGVPGSAARRGPLLLPGAALPVGSPVDPRWREVFGRVRTTLGLVPEGWSWAHGAGEEPWIGRADGGGHGRVADVAVGPPGRGGPVVVGVLDAWTETIPERDVPATAAFSFRTPRSRPPQAILLAVPPRTGDEVDVATARDVVRQAALLSRARSVPASRLGAVGALLPSAHLPAAERGGLELPGLSGVEDFSRGLHVRLEPAAPDAADLDEALRAEVGDPVWMLARQWQLGEHAGQDASSPVEYRLGVSQTPLRAPAGRAYADPRRVPGEVVLEAASKDVLLPDPVPGAMRDPWDAVGLWHRSELRAGVPPRPVAAPEHDGGVADWWSLDVEPGAGFVPVARRRRFRGLPGRMDYPGAPEPGWFTLEDPRQTVTGHLPDPSHVASLFFLDEIAGHATDWYLASLATPPGHVARLHDLAVTDAFGDVWPRAGEDWRSEADTWTTPFRTRGLEAHDLVAWFATPPPLQGDALEQVVMGVDEDADLLWVVEERVDGHDAPGPAGASVATPRGVEVGDRVGGTPPMRYQRLAPSPGPWHPYPAEDEDPLGPPGPPGPRRFRQGRLRVASRAGPVDGALPDPSSRFLAVRRSGRLPEIDPAAVPAVGLRLERRWVLARSRDGLPVVWQQRRRVVPRTPPAYVVGHDRTAPR
jgi:hypothetical protein